MRQRVLFASVGAITNPPVTAQTPTTFQPVVNPQTTKDLDFTLSPSILARADEVIE